MNHAKLQKRRCRKRTGVASRRGPGTGRRYNQIRMHSSQQKKSRIEPIVLKLAVREGKHWKFAGNYFKTLREANNFHLYAPRNM